MSLRAKFEELETLLLKQRHLLGLHSGVPFILLVYDPHVERACRSLQILLQQKLEARGVEVIEYELNTFIFDYYKGRGQLERIFELDRDPEQRGELRRMIAGVYEKELVNCIEEYAQGVDPGQTILFLTGVASIYPFARISSVLAELEGRVRVPLVVFYPGSETDGKLRFLNQEPHVGYRARRI